MPHVTLRTIVPATLAALATAIGLAWYLGRGGGPVPPGDATSHDAGPFRVTVVLDPETPRVGKNRLTVLLRDRDDAPVEGARIEAVAEMPAMGSMPAMRAPADMKPAGGGRYQGQFEISMDGAWPLSLEIRAPQGRARLQFDLTTSRAGLRLTQASPAPGRAAAPGDPGTLQAGPYRLAARAARDPAAAGRWRIEITARDARGAPVTGARLRAVAQKGEGRAAQNIPATVEEAGTGRYLAGLTLPEAGRWALAIDLETEDLGHGDLVMELDAGAGTLTALTATPDGVSHYTCSMHPSVKSATPGTCPICGMDLVPVRQEEVRSGAIVVDARRRQLIGVTTGRVARRPLARIIRAAGRITYDETRLADVTLKFDAWVGELYAHSTGVRVRAGEPLFTVYSPALVAAQEEYLETRRRRAPGDRLLAAARRRLALWDLRPAQLRALEKRGRPWEQVPILSPMNGTVVAKEVVPGSAVKRGQRLLRIADLSTVWVEGEVYEYELPHIRTGMQARVVLPELPGQERAATVRYVDPYVDPRTRTARVRVALPNPDGRLRPDMYAHVHLAIDQGIRLVVPEGAVLYAGHSRVAFVDLGQGRLQPRKIKTGVRNGEWIEVLEGLQEGERVVTSGNFLIAAESKLKSGLDQW